MLRPMEVTQSSVALLSAVLSFAAAACSVGGSDTKVPVGGAVLTAEGGLVLQSVCLPPERLVAEVVEDDGSVTVTVAALDASEGSNSVGNDDCAGVTKEQALASPLGDRKVIDGLSGRELLVDGR
jgi:hypothetical protein